MPNLAIDLAGGVVTAGAVLVDTFFVPRTTAFTTTDTTSPGTVIVSQVVDVPADSVLEILAAFAGTCSSVNVRTQLLVDGAKISAESQGGSSVSAASASYGGAMHWLGALSPGAHTIAVAVWTSAGTVTIDPTTNPIHHCELTIKVFA